MAGGQWWKKIATENGDHGTSIFDPFLGVSYERHLSPWLSVHSGIRYQPRSGLNISQSSAITQYSFGVEQITTQLKAQRIHYISLPLYLRVRLRGRHAMTFGANY